MRRVVALTAALLLLACSGPPPSAERRAAASDDLNTSGKPYQGPRGIRSTFPPADSSFDPLRCHIDGPGEVCTRSAD